SRADSDGVDALAAAGVRAAGAAGAACAARGGRASGGAVGAGARLRRVRHRGLGSRDRRDRAVNGARWASLALCAAGLLAGSLEPRAPAREALRIGTDWLLAVDFHVHGFPGDGALAPWLLRDEAARAGLDAFALTNHNRVSTARAARRMFGDTSGPLVIVGQEITAPGFHIAAAGLEERVDWTSGAAAAIRAV